MTREHKVTIFASYQLVQSTWCLANIALKKLPGSGDIIR